MSVGHFTITCPWQNPQGSLTRWWFRKHKCIQLNFILWQGHFYTVSSRNHQLLHNWEGERQNWKRNRIITYVHKSHLCFRVCGIKIGSKWLYSVNTSSLSVTPVSGFSLIVKAQALMGKITSSPSALCRYWAAPAPFLKSWNVTLRPCTGASVQSGPAGCERFFFADRFLAENPAAVSWQSKTNIAIYQTAISDLYKYMKNPRHFLVEKLLGG